MKRRKLKVVFSSQGLPVVLASLLAAAACGESVGTEGGVVGGPCTTAEDCASDSVCLVDKDFPGGACALSCSKHGDCPGGARCVDEDGGYCLLECYEPADCRGGYTCKGKKNQSGGGESLVCISD